MKSKLVVFIVSIIAVVTTSIFCSGFVMPQQMFSNIVYIKGLGSESWKSIPYNDVSIDGGIVTIVSQNGMRYITSINNVVIQR